MRVPRHVLAQVIAKRTLETSDTKTLAREIAAYLLTEGRTAELESILRDVMQYRQEHGILEADVVTAHQVEDEVLQDVKQWLKSAYPKAKNISLNQVHDAAVIGGIKIDMPNQQLDMTIKAKLSKFKTLTGAGGSL
ncbi:MAG: F0F1 ATP synthase subunit delta [Patescibacteria group bacterium]